jgi:hypothetical protein
MKATLNNFGIKFKNMPLLCDNESAIKLINNLVQHARTKHIDVHHPFIRDHQQKGDICIESVGTEDQLVDIFTKPLDEKRFCKLRNELNILDFSNMCWCTPPHLYDMPLLQSIQGKSWLAWHTSLLRTCLVHLVIFTFNRLIHENQMNLMIVWYHYCFYAWLDLVLAYDMFVGL